MKIEFYKAEDKDGKIIKLKDGEYKFPYLKKNKEMKIFMNNKMEYTLGKVKKYQFLGNMIYVKTQDDTKYFFEIICD